MNSWGDSSVNPKDGAGRGGKEEGGDYMTKYRVHERKAYLKNDNSETTERTSSRLKGGGFNKRGSLLTNAILGQNHEARKPK